VGRDRHEAGISNIGMILGMAGFLVVLLIVAIVVSVTLPTNDTTTTTTTTTGAGDNTANSNAPATTSTTAGGAGIATAAAVAACRSDVTDVQTALAAYQATNGSYPTPPAGWSAASYPTNFAPLTSATPPGPFLKMPPGDNEYVILWDSAGHIWVEPPGTFTPTYDVANDAGNATVCTRVAR
jgi:hypothetical protein